MSLTLLPPPHSHPSQAEASRCNGSTQNATQGQASTPVATSNNGPGSSTPTRSSSAANISSAVSSSVGRRETPRAPTRRASLPALTPSLSGRLPSAQGAPAPETASDERSLSGAAGLRTGTCSAVTPESLRTMQGPPLSAPLHPRVTRIRRPAPLTQRIQAAQYRTTCLTHTACRLVDTQPPLPPSKRMLRCFRRSPTPCQRTCTCTHLALACCRASCHRQHPCRQLPRLNPPTRPASASPSLEPRHLCQRGWW